MKFSCFIIIIFLSGLALSAQTGNELYRPAYHFSPQQNWINDPNGLVYFDGEYHLFYQYNPYGDQWGNMSWGHAVSDDFIEWEQLPVAIPVTGGIMAFSGSAVVDWENTSGFGNGTEPPMVAIYTGAGNNSQTQYVAFSNDRGRSFELYEGNPVINMFNNDFRDPKVFWHHETGQWIMVVSLGSMHRVRFFKSADLKQWEFLHDFGNVGDQSGAWECPDLFPLAVDGDSLNIKWVLQVDVGPGKSQYFTGNFDGNQFVADKYPPETIQTLPEGELLADFDGDYFGAWTASGNAFGNGPAQGEINGQIPVDGFLGSGFANSYHGGDEGTGVLSSPDFTITHNYLNFKIGGGYHPESTFVALYIEGLKIFSATGRDDEFLFWESWDVENYIGLQANIQVVDYSTAGWGHINADHFFLSDVSMSGSVEVNGAIFDDFEQESYQGWTVIGEAFGDGPAEGTLPNQMEVSGYLGQRLVNSYFNGDETRGKMISQDFTIDSTYISFLIGGGNHPEGTFICLKVAGEEKFRATGNNSEALKWESWDVSDFIGQTASLEIVDSVSGGWGHINIDHIIQTNIPPQTGEADYVDHGKDFYAVQSYNDIPDSDGRRIWLAWMSNWEYAGDVPTSPWRGIMSVPREVGLTMIDDQFLLSQKPVEELQDLRDTLISFENDFVSNIKLQFDQIRYQTFEIQATIDLMDAREFGFKLKTGNGQETIISYDAAAAKIFFDRSSSGSLTNHSSFAEKQEAAMTLEDGKIDLRILVDHCSVEVFANDGTVVFSNLIFPDSTSTGMDIFSIDGDAFVETLKIWKLKSPQSSTAINDFQLPTGDIIISPNPSNSEDIHINVSNQNLNIKSIEVYDTNGLRIFVESFQNPPPEIVLKNYIFAGSGIYFFKAKTAGKPLSGKIIISK